MKKISSAFVMLISMLITCSCSQKSDGLPKEEIPTENTDEPTNRGCTKIWTTYEAENGTTDGFVLDKNYTQGTYESESSGRSCVMLRSENQQVTVTTSSIESNLKRIAFVCIMLFGLNDIAISGNLTNTAFINGNEFGFSPDSSGVSNAQALQKAIDGGGSIYISDTKA